MRTKQLHFIEKEDRILRVYQVMNYFKNSFININYFVVESINKEEGEVMTSTANSFESLAELLVDTNLTPQEKSKAFDDCCDRIEPFTIDKSNAWTSFLMCLRHEYDYYKGWKEILHYIKSNSDKLVGTDIHELFRTKEILRMTEDKANVGLCFGSIEECDEKLGLTHVLKKVLSEILGQPIGLRDYIII